MTVTQKCLQNKYIFSFYFCQISKGSSKLTILVFYHFRKSHNFLGMGFVALCGCSEFKLLHKKYFR